MNLFKKIVAGASIFAVAVVSVAPGVSAYTNAQLEAANTLAASGVIVDHSNDPMAYNMDQTVLRQEIAAVARGIYEVDNSMVVNSAKVDTCTNAFADVSATNPNTWACYTVEGLLNADVIAGNSTFRPEENITKSEALGMVVKATCNDYAFDASSTMTWQQQLGAYASAKGIASFSDYTTAATRGFTFEAGVNAMNACSDVVDDSTDSLLDDLLSDLDGDTDTGTGTDTDTDTDTGTTTPVTGGVIEVTLSPETPASATIPASVNGIPVASFDFTAGDSDVTISQITVKRRGLSDQDTLLSVAAFTDAGRASNEKNDNQENDTEAQLNLSGGGVVIMAGETRTITIVADLNTAALAANDEFAIELVEVAASADVEVQGSLQANTMRIGSVDAPEITITGGSSVSDPKLGEKGADIFEFEIEGANDEDVVLKSITFEGDSDAEDNLMNFELYMGNNLVASTEAMNDDYLTFNLGDGITIEEDKNEDFTVKADVVEGATDTIQFRIDQALDVTAESTKFGFGAAVDITDADAFGDFDGITIEAGELTIVEIEPDFDEVREDKDNVVLGGIKVTNVAGQNLELQEFGVRIVATNAGGAFVDNGAGGGTAGNDVLDGTEGLNVIDIFDDVELYSVDTGSSYELTSTTAGLDAVFSENSIDVLLPEGTTEWEIRADTADDIFMFDDVSFTLSFVTGTIGANGGFYVEETEDDEAVNDITPSSITFNSLDGSESGAQVSLNNLADLTVVRGADDVVALQFEIEAEESSDIVVDEVTVNVQSTVIGAATNQEIAEVKLYKGSVSESNLLDTESGSNIGATGDVTFDDVGEIMIDANDTVTFVVVISIVDGDDAVTNSSYNVSLTALDIEDDENDDVAVVGLPLVSARDISVNGFGVLSITEDSNNTDNEDPKTILAGNDAVVFSADVQSVNEAMDIETVVFTVDTDLTGSLVNATLLLDGVEIDTNSYSDITATTITFDDLDTLIVEEATSELQLQLNTETIGFQKVGTTVTGINVTGVALNDVEGVDSGKDGANQTLIMITSSEDTAIVPAIVTPSAVAKLGTSTSQAKLMITADFGDNTQDANNSTPTIELDTLTFSSPGGNVLATDYEIYAEGESGDTVPGVLVSGNITFDMNAFADANNGDISDDKTYFIVPTIASGDTASLTLIETGILYDVTVIAGSTGITSNMDQELDMGTRSID